MDTPMTLDEAKAAAHRDTPYEWKPGLCGPECPQCTLATVAYNAGKVAGWDENVKACVEAQRKAAEGMRERAAVLCDPAPEQPQSFDTGRMWSRATGAGLAKAIRALPLEDKP